MATAADIHSALAPVLHLTLITATDVHGRRGDTLQIAKAGGRYTRRTTSTQYIYDDWELIGRFQNAQTDDALDALVTDVYDGLERGGVIINPDSYEYEYEPVSEGNFRNLIIRFTTARTRPD